MAQVPGDVFEGYGGTEAGHVENHPQHLAHHNRKVAGVGLLQGQVGYSACRVSQGFFVSTAGN